MSKDQVQKGDQKSSKQRVWKPAPENRGLQPEQLDQLETLIQSARADPRGLKPRQVLQLQRTVGNQVVRQLIRPKKGESTNCAQQRSCSSQQIQVTEANQRVAGPAATGTRQDLSQVSKRNLGALRSGKLISDRQQIEPKDEAIQAKVITGLDPTNLVQQNGKSIPPALQRRIIFNELDRTSSPPVSKKKIFTKTDVQKYIRNLGKTNHAFDDIISGKGKEYSFIGGRGYRKRLIKSIIKDMDKASTDLFFNSQSEFEAEVRKRAVTSLDMRVSQGRTRGSKPTGYPPRTADSWAAIANSAAKKYWTVTIVKGDYNFTLSPDGKNNAYEALTKLIFSHQTSKSKRTLMHCDYVISAIHFKVMAESMGVDKFNKEVKDGRIEIKLQDLSIYKILQKETESKSNRSLMRVELDSEDDLIIGDHVIFYNHPAYDSLNANIGQSWRLENAFVIDDLGPGKSKRFQGHGYFSPKSRSAFIRDMMSKFNTLVFKARALFNRYKRRRTTANETKLKDAFPNVIYKDNAGNILSQPKIQYEDGGNKKEMPLAPLKPKDYKHPFSSSSTGKIEVYRPMESRPND